MTGQPQTSGDFRESRFGTQHILTRGGVPPQPFIPEGLDEQDMFLFAAWAHGIGTADAIPDHTLFLYIQTHIQSRSTERLEQFLAMSPYLIKYKVGLRKLTEEGNAQLARFGTKPEKFQTDCEYAFLRTFHETQYAVCADSSGRKRVFMDRALSTTAMILRKLQKQDSGIVFEESAWTPSSLLNWILYDEDYSWIRL
jgi:hypothetical protein